MIKVISNFILILSDPFRKEQADPNISSKNTPESTTGCGLTNFLVQLYVSSPKKKSELN